MITFKQIRTTITRKLKATFKGIDVSAKSANEGFKRPSFKVELDNVKREGSLTQVEKSCTVRIFYFPTDADDNAAELLDIQEDLGDLFDLKFSVEGRHLDVLEPNFDEVDGVLQFEFDIAFEEGRMGIPQQESTDDNVVDNNIINEIIYGKEFYEKHPIELMGEVDYEEDD